MTVKAVMDVRRCNKKISSWRYLCCAWLQWGEDQLLPTRRKRQEKAMERKFLVFAPLYFLDAHDFFPVCCLVCDQRDTLTSCSFFVPLPAGSSIPCNIIWEEEQAKTGQSLKNNNEKNVCTFASLRGAFIFYHSCPCLYHEAASIWLLFVLALQL